MKPKVQVKPEKSLSRSSVFVLNGACVAHVLRCGSILSINRPLVHNFCLVGFLFSKITLFFFFYHSSAFLFKSAWISTANFGNAGCGGLFWRLISLCEIHFRFRLYVALPFSLITPESDTTRQNEPNTKCPLKYIVRTCKQRAYVDVLVWSKTLAMCTNEKAGCGDDMLINTRLPIFRRKNNIYNENLCK